MAADRDHVELFRGADGDWYFTVRAGNGEAISQSEGYSRKDDALDTLAGHYPGLPIAIIEETP